MNLKKALVLLWPVAGLISCKQPVLQAPSPRPVKIAEVTSFSTASNSFSGAVSPDQFSNLAFKMSGPLVAVSVDEGQSVKKGQVIAKVDPRDYQLDYDAKKASFLTAESQLQRAEKLIGKQAISQQEFESTRASYENAKAAYENARQTLEQTVLTAPFDGFIQKKYVENYQEVRPGDKIVTLINPDKLQMQATLPENALSYITRDPEIYVEFDAYKGIKFKAKIKEYVQASPDGSGIPIFVTITDPRFSLDKYKVAVGFSCTIEIVISEPAYRKYTVVPLSALVTVPDSGRKSVFVYNPAEKKVYRRVIKDGEVFDKDRIIVSEGLQPGEWVVSAGATRLREGEEVKLLND